MRLRFCPGPSSKDWAIRRSLSNFILEVERTSIIKGFDKALDDELSWLII